MTNNNGTPSTSGSKTPSFPFTTSSVSSNNTIMVSHPMDTGLKSPTSQVAVTYGFHDNQSVNDGASKEALMGVVGARVWVWYQKREYLGRVVESMPEVDMFMVEMEGGSWTGGSMKVARGLQDLRLWESGERNGMWRESGPLWQVNRGANNNGTEEDDEDEEMMDMEMSREEDDVINGGDDDVTEGMELEAVDESEEEKAQLKTSGGNLLLQNGAFYNNRYLRIFPESKFDSFGSHSFPIPNNMSHPVEVHSASSGYMSASQSVTSPADSPNAPFTQSRGVSSPGAPQGQSTDTPPCTGQSEEFGQSIPLVTTTNVDCPTSSAFTNHRGMHDLQGSHLVLSHSFPSSLTAGGFFLGSGIPSPVSTESGHHLHSNPNSSTHLSAYNIPSNNNQLQQPVLSSSSQSGQTTALYCCSFCSLMTSNEEMMQYHVTTMHLMTSRHIEHPFGMTSPPGNLKAYYRQIETNVDRLTELLASQLVATSPQSGHLGHPSPSAVPTSPSMEEAIGASAPNHRHRIVSESQLQLDTGLEESFSDSSTSRPINIPGKNYCRVPHKKQRTFSASHTTAPSLCHLTEESASVHPYPTYLRGLPFLAHGIDRSRSTSWLPTSTSGNTRPLPSTLHEHCFSDNEKHQVNGMPIVTHNHTYPTNQNQANQSLQSKPVSDWLNESTAVSESLRMATSSTISLHLLASSAPSLSANPLLASSLNNNNNANSVVQGNRRVRSDVKKCRKVYGIDQRDRWCNQCKWKKACRRFPDPDLNPGSS